jgi:hypothetical protein
MQDAAVGENPGTGPLRTSDLSTLMTAAKSRSLLQMKQNTNDVESEPDFVMTSNLTKLFSGLQRLKSVVHPLMKRGLGRAPIYGGYLCVLQFSQFAPICRGHSFSLSTCKPVFVK